MDLYKWEELRDRLCFSSLGKPALIGLAALLLMVAVFAGKNIVETATASEFKVDHGQAAQESSEAAQEPETIFVHVSGAVEKPGLVELQKGSRVADAVNAAGGFAGNAATESVNLARVLEDGEQLYVSALVDPGADGGQAGAEGDGDGAGASAQGGEDRGGDAGPGASAVSGGGGGSQPSGKVNLNTATQEELESLPGIGPSTASKIVADRKANGSFKTVDELTRVSGIGEKKLSAIADLVCV